jgi:hypothetical protein
LDPRPELLEEVMICFLSLTELEMKYGRDAEGKGTREWSAKGPVLINVGRILYANPARSHSGTEITFMDFEESSCCVSVSESFEEVGQRLRQLKADAS